MSKTTVSAPSSARNMSRDAAHAAALVYDTAHSDPAAVRYRAERAQRDAKLVQEARAEFETWVGDMRPAKLLRVWASQQVGAVS